MSLRRAIALTFRFNPASLVQPTEADELDNRIFELYQAGRYADATPLAQRALSIREKALEPDHLDVATALYSLARLNDRQGSHADAEPLYKRALAIYEKTLGCSHLAANLPNFRFVRCAIN